MQLHAFLLERQQTTNCFSFISHQLISLHGSSDLLRPRGHCEWWPVDGRWMNDEEKKNNVHHLLIKNNYRNDCQLLMQAQESVDWRDKQVSFVGVQSNSICVLAQKWQNYIVSAKGLGFKILHVHIYKLILIKSILRSLYRRSNYTELEN